MLILVQENIQKRLISYNEIKKYLEFVIPKKGKTKRGISSIRLKNKGKN